MPGILVVERSATLNHLVSRTLAAAHSPPAEHLDSYLEAIEALRRAFQADDPFDVVVIGVPARATREYQMLLHLLMSTGGRGFPVLLMAHERSAEVTDWAGARANTSVLLWSHFSKIPVALRQLAPQVGASPAAVAPAPLPGGALRVLFVDDSQSVRFAYKQLLEKNGFAVETAASITEGVAAAARAHFDLFVFDYFLPDGNGDELCTRVRALPGHEGVSIAILTGTYREDIIKRCLEAGAVECMFKNEAKELFLARIKGLARQIDMQKSIEAERQRLDGILGSVGDGVYGVGNDGRVTFINPTGLRILGLDDDASVVGHPAEQLIPATGEGHADARGQLTRAYASGEAMNLFETMFAHREGHPVPVELSVLPLSIQNRREGSVVVFRDISERKSAERLRWELNHDNLTGLPNSRHLTHALGREIARCREHGGYSALLFIDLDRFAYVIESVGQGLGDRILAEVAQRLGKHLRKGDVLARMEQDCFALLLPNVQLDNLFTIADAFRDVVHTCRYDAHGQPRNLTSSVGVAILSRETPSVEFALENARVACQQAKHKGRDQTQLYVPDPEGRIARELDAGWTDRFREAIRQDRFVLLVQPIVPVLNLAQDEAQMRSQDGWRMNGGDGKRTYIFELLLRMVSRDGQWISPAVFVPLAERVGMMPKIDLWVISRMLRSLAVLATRKLPVAVTVNLSNLTLQDPDALGHIAELIQRSGVDPTQLVFEITETAEIGNLPNARRFIQTLKKLGCRFALDDFGTGFSSFNHLRNLPVDLIKIEGSFVERMRASEVDRTMVGSITSMAHSLDLEVIAEHCDSFATLDLLRACGVDYVQGHFIGEPRPLDEVDFSALLENR